MGTVPTLPAGHIVVSPVSHFGPGPGDGAPHLQRHQQRADRPAAAPTAATTCTGANSATASVFVRPDVVSGFAAPV
ncbi:hypothetical protein [Streptomyces sp. NPDC005336]|uniref:hypothetical protein n=1 Tax=unclassified Streptomyces TaxID=2593676 RepID=UPI00339EDB3E